MLPNFYFTKILKDNYDLLSGIKKQAELYNKYMTNLEMFASYIFVIQLAHSFEELITGFHKRWYLFKMPFRLFLGFELLFNLFWALVLFSRQFPAREQLLAFFIVLMFANGIQHIVWFALEKKYVPGLITAPMHVILFLVYYYQVIFG